MAYGSSVFCLAPAGDMCVSSRINSAIAAGCIPVLLCSRTLSRTLALTLTLTLILTLTRTQTLTLTLPLSLGAAVR